MTGKIHISQDLTPHMLGHTTNPYDAKPDVLADNANRMMRGELPHQEPRESRAPGSVGLHNWLDVLLWFEVPICEEAGALLRNE